MKPQSSLNPDVYEKMYQKIVYFLSFKDRTEKELLDALKKYLKKTSLIEVDKEHLIAQVMQELQEEGYVDDLEYSKTYIIEVVNAKTPKSKKAIKVFLYKKGVSNSDIEAAFDQVYTQEYEVEAAEKVAEKRLQVSEFVDEAKQIQDLKTYLFGKGFSSDAINSVVDTKFKRY